MTWPLFGDDRRREADHRREPRVAEARGEHDARAVERSRARVAARSDPARGSIAATPCAPSRATPARAKRRVQRAQQPQRVAVAVQRAPRAADDVGPDRPAIALPAPRGRARRRRSARSPAARTAARSAAPRASSSRCDRHTCSAARLPQRDVDAGLARAAARRGAATRAPSAASTRRTAAGRAPCPAPRSGRSCRARRDARRRLRRARRASRPSSRRPNAIAAPTRPPPMTTTSKCRVLIAHPRRRQSAGSAAGSAPRSR